MSRSSCQRATPKLNLKGLQYEANRGDYIVATSEELQCELNSKSASESDSEDYDSDTCYSEASRAGESVRSNRATPEPICTTLRNEEELKLLEPQICALRFQKRDRLVGGLVANNDFFTPRSNLVQSPALIEIPPSNISNEGRVESLASGIELSLGRNEKIDPHPDSLRGRYAVKSTPRPQSATTRMGTPSIMTPRDASNYSVGHVIKERVNNFTKRIQQSYNTERRVCKTGKSVSARDLELQLLEYGITPIYQPEIWLTQPPPKAIIDTIDVRSFLGCAAPEGYAPIQCYIQRHFKKDWIFPRFKLYLQEGNHIHFLLSARKRKKSMSSNYILSLDGDDISRRTGNYFGKLHSNFLGTEFWLYDKGARPKLSSSEASINRRMELGAIKYQHNPLGLQGPRKMTTVIPALDKEGKPYIHQLGPTGAHSLLTKYKSGQDLHKMVILNNKKPVWNNKEKTKSLMNTRFWQKMCYYLNFNGRVTMPSVKNFQLIKDEEPENIILQFGKVGKNVYHMDYKYPMSALQAFAIALTSVDNKIACE